MSDWYPLAAMVAAAVAIYALRERHRRRTEVRPPQPDIGMQAIPAGEDLREELEAVERRALASEHPRRAVREAVLHNATMALHLRAIAALPEAERQLLLEGYQAGMGPMLEAALERHERMRQALRIYLRLKYDDAVESDWFDHFLHEAGAYIREKVRLARDFLMQVDPGAKRFAEIYDELLEDLRQRALAAPPKYRFPPPESK
ncbi:MAG: hypothetical protein M1541_00740 [Acidobacteria bacterium]|nr:hypothetical protein [Acidobacteriota bacterium]